MTRGTEGDDQLPETIKVHLINANGEVTAIGSLQTKTGEVRATIIKNWGNNRLTRGRGSVVPDPFVPSVPSRLTLRHCSFR